MDMKEMLLKLTETMSGESLLTEAKNDENDELAKPMTVKSKISETELVNLLFTDADAKVGRIALRKVLKGKEVDLTLRERTAMAGSFIRILPVISTDRSIFTRFKKKLAEG